MSEYDKIFKHIAGEFSQDFAVLALKTSEVEVTGRLNTEHITVKMHQSDMVYHVRLPDEEAIMQKSPFYEHVIQRGIEQGREQGRIDEKRTAVLKVVRHRFANISDVILNEISGIDDLVHLDDLFDQVLTAESFDDIDFSKNGK